MTVESSVQNLTACFLLVLGHELGAAQAYTGPLSTLIDFRRDLSDDEVDLFLYTIDTQTVRLTTRLDELTELARLQRRLHRLYTGFLPDVCVEPLATLYLKLWAYDATSTGPDS